jgi:hypothetical protein
MYSHRGHLKYELQDIDRGEWSDSDIDEDEWNLINDFLGFRLIKKLKK